MPRPRSFDAALERNGRGVSVPGDADDADACARGDAPGPVDGPGWLLVREDQSAPRVPPSQVVRISSPARVRTLRAAPTRMVRRPGLRLRLSRSPHRSAVAGK